MYQAALQDILEHLMSDGKTLSDFNLPQPPAAGPRENRLLFQERHAYDMQQITATLARYPDLNADQRSVFDTVRASGCIPTRHSVAGKVRHLTCLQYW